MSKRFDYNTIQRTSETELFTETDTLSILKKISILQTYLYKDPETTGNDIIVTFELPVGDIIGRRKFIALSDSNAIAKVNMPRGSFILDVEYPSVELIWDEDTWHIINKKKPPVFVTRQLGTKLIGTGFSGGSRQGSGVSISADGNTLAVGGNRDSGLGSEVGATWVFTRNGTVWTQQGTKLVGTGFSGDSNQGVHVSLSADGNTLVSGAQFDDQPGQIQVGGAWIFTRSGTVWTQQGEKLVGTGRTSSSRQGFSVSLSADGNTLVSGAVTDGIFGSEVGATWVFTRNGTVWTQQGTKLVGTGYTGDSGQGVSVKLSADGNTFASGGYFDNGEIGATWVFTRNGTVWTQQGTKLVGTGNAGNGNQGTAVSLSANGNTLVIGAPLDDGLGTDIGAMWVFTRNGIVWTQQGIKLVGTGFSGDSNQGRSISMSGDGNTFYSGGYLNDGLGTDVGATWIFSRKNSVWTQQGTKLIGTGFSGDSQQGLSTALSANGNILVVGGDRDDGSGTDVGSFWIFI